jgi:hypothetical protein
MRCIVAGNDSITTMVVALGVLIWVIASFGLLAVVGLSGRDALIRNANSIREFELLFLDWKGVIGNFLEKRGQ